MALRIVEEESRTDQGRQRTTNEDAFLRDSPVFAVADGMGGARAGEVAAQIAMEAFDEHDSESDGPEARLEQIARNANRKIHALSREDESRAGMGTTLSAVIVGEHDVTIGHVGDSRVYRLRDERLERLTRDHSLVEELVRQGKLTPDEAEVHPQRSIITRALGPEPEVEVETLTFPGRDGDVYLLCSDGLTAMVSEQRIAEILLSRASLEQAASQLVNVANANGGKDNITVVLFRLASEERESDEQETLAGQETATGVSTDDVRAALAASENGQESSPERSQQRTATAQRAPSDATFVMPPADARRLREESEAGRRQPPTGPGRMAPLERGRSAPRRARRLLGAVLALVVLAAVAIGFWVGSRQFYFLGTDDSGLVTLYRGLPYELPFGATLYEEEYVSGVPARSIAGPRRERILDHQLRGRGDAVDLVRQLERGRTVTR